MRVNNSQLSPASPVVRAERSAEASKRTVVYGLLIIGKPVIGRAWSDVVGDVRSRC